MSDQWMRLQSAPRPGIILTLGGAIAVGAALFAPLFGTTKRLENRRSERTNYSLWDLRDAAPNVGWLLAGLLLLLAITAVLQKHPSPTVNRVVLTLAVAESAGLLLATTMAFTQLSEKLSKPLEFRWGLLLLTLAVGALISGASSLRAEAESGH
ncbi:hypothetical protein ACWIGI_34360 [Nocardia sp. NPDC055321]